MKTDAFYELNRALLVLHEISTLHPTVKPLCDTAVTSIHEAMPSLDGSSVRIAISPDLYNDLHAFLEARADVDYDQERWLANQAMRLLVELERQSGVF